MIMLRVGWTLRRPDTSIYSPYFRCWTEGRLRLGRSNIASMSWVTASLLQNHYLLIPFCSQMSLEHHDTYKKRRRSQILMEKLLED
ncbi:uncharacterized [Tachysurus ichikawai]